MIGSMAVRKFPVVLLLLLAMPLSACEQQAVPALPARIPARSVTVTPEKIVMIENLPGRVSALTVSEVRPQVSGIVTERLFEEGATVTEGQVLYRIDPELYAAAHNEAKANLANAEANARTARLRYERYGRLVKTGAVGVQDYDDATAASKRADEIVRSAEQQLESARINLGYTIVTAPVSGEVGRSFITPGALVTKNQSGPMATIRQLDPVYVDVKAPSAMLVTLRRALAAGDVAGDQRTVKVRLLLEDGLPYTSLAKNGEATGEDSEPEPLEGNILFSEVTVDQSTGTVLLRIRFANPDALLLPGMYVRALVETGELQNALLVPQASVLRDTRNRPYVFVLTKKNPLAGEREQRFLEPDEYYVAQRLLTLDRNFGDRWLATSGLSAGDMVLTDNLQKVRPGTVVTAVPEKAETSSVRQTQTGEVQ